MARAACESCRTHERRVDGNSREHLAKPMRGHRGRLTSFLRMTGEKTRIVLGVHDAIFDVLWTTPQSTRARPHSSDTLHLESSRFCRSIDSRRRVGRHRTEPYTLRRQRARNDPGMDRIRRRRQGSRSWEPRGKPPRRPGRFGARTTWRAPALSPGGATRSDGSSSCYVQSFVSRSRRG